MPLELVVAVKLAPPLKVLLAPEDGALNLTETPATGCPPASAPVAADAGGRLEFAVIFEGRAGRGGRDMR